ncbi:MAG: type IV secretory system conjugative DNA transfer family protein, partial [Clostridia bacterium]|nr:type IV secretory system conjugative DNA transfer family protein [Clostridia bacterium]
MDYRLGKYQNVNQETRWATPEEIRRSTTYINLHDDVYPPSGIPIKSDGHEAYVDSQDTHTLVFGATGSKKTRLFCMPTLNFFIKSGESFVATDPKGELFARTSGMAKANGYNIVVLNFRDIGKGDMWNPLALPYELYHNGRKDEAVAMLNDFVKTISASNYEKTQDVFWPEMASSYAVANLLLLMEAADPQEVNVKSLAALCSGSAKDKLKTLSDNMSMDSIAGMNYKNVLVNPERTMNCIMSALYS